MVGQMLMAGFRGYEVNESSPIIHDIQNLHLGGVVLFDYDVALKKAERNIKNPTQVAKLTKTLQAHAETPLFVAVDQEGGRVQRLKPKHGFVGTPSAQELGSRNNGRIRSAASIIGLTLKSSGFNLDFAPDVDVNVNPDSPAIGKIGRSFSSDPERVGQCATLFLEEFRQLGVIGCLKHFPGHGSAGADSHLGLTDVTQTWSQAELIPYRMLIDNGLTDMVMTAHIFNANLDPDYPATLSHKVITGLLRNKLGFKGVVVTDDMNMKAITEFYGRDTAIRLAIEAGADILLFGNNLIYDPNIVKTTHAIITKLVENGTIRKERIEQSYERIINLKEKRI
ncbi:MAG: glycoside hydrolase family 3 [Pseudodesulfovibrio sp.]|nr:glycoside hydrolase family 3 [Pseudodesulfovibrio sp.]